MRTIGPEVPETNGDEYDHGYDEGLMMAVMEDVPDEGGVQASHVIRSGEEITGSGIV